MNAKAWLHFGLDTMSAASKEQRNLGLPIHVTIEPTNICQLCCPVCETGARILQRPKGSMSFAKFNFILYKLGGQVDTIFLYFMGETFLNSESYTMIRVATAKGIFVSACTNGESVAPMALVQSGISEISFQIGGMSQETHAHYRVGSQLDKVLANIEETRRLSNMRIGLGFIVMKHNEHEIQQFWQYCRDVGVTGRLVYPCVRNVEQGKEFLPANRKYWIYDEQKFKDGVLKPKVVPHNRCWWIYYSTVITWNGDVVPCCRDVHGEFVMGNILEQDLRQIWNGINYQHFRRMIANNQSAVSLCRLCSGYLPPLPLRANR